MSDKNNIKNSDLIFKKRKEKKLVKLIFCFFFLEEQEELRTMCSSFSSPTKFAQKIKN